MIDRWREVFDDAFGRNDKHKARNFTSMALEARNAISHLAIGLQDDEALRYLDAMHQLLKLVKGAGKRDRRTQEALRRAAPVRDLPARRPLPCARRRAEARSRDRRRACSKPLKPWIEVALPHPDVIANRFKEAEFAADLFAVDAGHAGEGYATPSDFFGITFLTEGLKRVLTISRAAARRQRRRSGHRPADRLRWRQDAHDARDLPSREASRAMAAIHAACRASASS